MNGTGAVDVAVVGLGFGEDFLPLYAAHPSVGEVGIVDQSRERLTEVGDRHGIAERFTDIADVLADERWDAVHILAPVAFHSSYALAVLGAGKHCACAVPMATDVADLHAIVAAQRESGKNYMMMETAVYGREYLVAEEMYRKGELGGLTFYRGYHIQNLDGYPEYWRGYPPMKYITHALAPILALTGSTVADVTAYGSSKLTADRVGSYDNPFPLQVGLFRLVDSDVVADVTMSFFQTARSYVEGFSVYGDRRSLEWSGAPGEAMRLFELRPAGPAESPKGSRGRHARESVLEPPDYAHRLPEQLARFVRTYTLESHDGGPATTKTAGHGGSHPYLVHEFISSIVETRPPAIDAVTSAAWTAPGIVAHESALRGGERLTVPSFDG
ncbi:Gfo/Idh/MocA family oxidoreductase [Actinopolymorpha sp. B11F2]|uniref:Gfo/Idh/MocA family protein n=1 Tax=Actinopolymorpha sp. B11F2 TaxID=3160862 RepID=UPI0032E3997A